MYKTNIRRLQSRKNANHLGTQRAEEPLGGEFPVLCFQLTYPRFAEEELAIKKYQQT